MDLNHLQAKIWRSKITKVFFADHPHLWNYRNVDFDCRLGECWVTFVANVDSRRRSRDLVLTWMYMTTWLHYGNSDLLGRWMTFNWHRYDGLQRSEELMFSRRTIQGLKLSAVTGSRTHDLWICRALRWPLRQRGHLKTGCEKLDMIIVRSKEKSWSKKKSKCLSFELRAVL